jgi:hypothetical protein
MKKFIIGAFAFALVMGGLTGCETYEQTAVKDTPVEQRARLYLVDRNVGAKKGRDYLDYLDENRTGVLKIGRISWSGGLRVQTTKPIFEVTPGEHKVEVFSNSEILPIKKKYEATYNFEAGKRYRLQVGLDPSYTLKDIGKVLIPDNYILIITDMDAK